MFGWSAIARMGFAAKMAWRYRRALKRYLTDIHQQVQCVTQITPAMLHQADVAILVLDYDGVLAPHGQTMPDATPYDWLKQLAMTIGEQRIAIFTNNPKPARLAWLTTHFPNMHVLTGFQKKPYPEALQTLAAQFGLAPSRLLLVDDRLLTGMLACELTPCQGRLLMTPLKRWWPRPVTEGFFCVLRFTERVFIRVFG